MFSEYMVMMYLFFNLSVYCFIFRTFLLFFRGRLTKFIF